MKTLTLILVLVTLLTGHLFAADFSWAPFHNRFVPDTVWVQRDTTTAVATVQASLLASRAQSLGSVGTFAARDTTLAYAEYSTSSGKDSVFRALFASDSVSVTSNSGWLFGGWREREIDSVKFVCKIATRVVAAGATGRLYAYPSNYIKFTSLISTDWAKWRTAPYRATGTIPEGIAFDSLDFEAGTDTITATFNMGTLLTYADSILSLAAAANWFVTIITYQDAWADSTGDDGEEVVSSAAILTQNNAYADRPYFLVYSTEVPQVIPLGENNKGVYLNRSTIYGRQPLILQLPTPNGLNNVGLGFVAVSVAGQTDSISYSYRPHINELTTNLDTVQIGSPPYSICLLTGDNPPTKSDKWLDWESGAYYHSLDPDATAGTGLEALKPQACRVLEIWVQAGSSDTVDVTTMVSWE